MKNLATKRRKFTYLVENSIWHHCSHGHIQLGRVFPSLLQFGLFPKKQQTLLSDQMKGKNRGLTPSNYNYAKNRINDICKTFDELHYTTLPVKKLLSSHTSNSSSNAKLNKSKYMKIFLQKFCRYDNESQPY